MHRTGNSSVDLRRVDGQEDARPPVTLFIDFLISRHIFSSSQDNDHLVRTIHNKKVSKDKNIKHKQPPQKKNNTGTPAFRGSGSPTFPPGSNCLFSSLTVFLPLCLRLVCREAVFDEATGVVVTLPVRVPITRSVGGKVFPPNLNPRQRASSPRQ